MGCQFSEAIEQGRLAVRAARAAGSDEALAAALDGQKASVAYLGEIDELAPLIEELEPLTRRLGDLRRLHWTLFESAFPALAAGDWPAAIARIETSLEVCRRSGSMSHAIWHVGVLGSVARLRGRYDEAIRIGRRAMEPSEEAPHAWTSAVAGAELGMTLLEAGAAGEAISLLERTMEVARQDGAVATMLRCLAPLAEATGSAATEAAAALRLAAELGRRHGLDRIAAEAAGVHREEIAAAGRLPAGHGRRRGLRGSPARGAALMHDQPR